MLSRGGAAGASATIAGSSFSGRPSRASRMPRRPAAKTAPAALRNLWTGRSTRSRSSHGTHSGAGVLADLTEGGRDRHPQRRAVSGEKCATRPRPTDRPPDGQDDAGLAHAAGVAVVADRDRPRHGGRSSSSAGWSSRASSMDRGSQRLPSGGKPTRYPCRRSSRAGASKPPRVVTLARVAQAVVQPVVAVLPEVRSPPERQVAAIRRREKTSWSAKPSLPISATPASTPPPPSRWSGSGARPRR